MIVEPSAEDMTPGWPPTWDVRGTCCSISAGAGGVGILSGVAAIVER